MAGWDSTNGRLTYPFTKIAANGNGDLQLALSSSLTSQIRLFTEPEIATFAKWHPLRSNVVSLSTDYERKIAGRVGDDLELVYGVRASGFGQATTITGLHSCRFNYERPTAAEAQAGTVKLRSFDFVAPSDIGPTNYGYRKYATSLDFSGVANTADSSGAVVVGQNSHAAASFTLTYSPYTTEQRKEFISILDWLTNPNETLMADPSNCFPCILISQGDKHFMHALTTSTTTDASTSGSMVALGTGSKTYYLDTTNMPVGTGDNQIAPNTTSLASVFLCSQKYINSNQYLYNWLKVSASGEQQVLTAVLIPVPNLSGFTFSVGASTVPTVANLITVEAVSGGFNITYTYSSLHVGSGSTYIWGTFTVDGSTYNFDRNISFSNVRPNTYTAAFTYSDLGIVVNPGKSMVFNVRVNTTISGATVAGTGITNKTITSV